MSAAIIPKSTPESASSNVSRWIFSPPPFAGDKDRGFQEINPSIVVGFLTGASNAVLNPDFILENNLTIEDSIVAFKSLFLSGPWGKERENRHARPLY